MPYAAEFQIVDDYVRLDVTGERRPGDAAAQAGDVIEKTVEFCRSVGVYRVLVVLHLEGRLSALDSYDIVVHAKDHGWTHAFKLAFVERHRDTFADVKFTEIVAANRAYPIRAFESEAEALGWLREDAKVAETGREGTVSR